ncbi:hypothetical protein E1293_21935 [Actinomadura darangshiensis]|uniref:Secreted protein n=1 Tax=Actinomadura darangshiensis TaxID=705336 RepID=A0A4R5B9A2_9ACTN|nr:DUF6493 family protein [Actinomadura darangshiensis]TDD79932.1 hypothetical protein E1293_21935 [Actinomadura darangshiensis]
MSTWDDLQKAIGAGDVERTAELVGGLDDAGRREVANELPGRLKAMRAASAYGFLDRNVLEPLLLAGAATIGGPAAAATWLCRRDLRLWWSGDRYARLCTLLGAVTSDRPAEWRAEVAHRVADRIRISDGDWTLWHIAATFARSAGAAPPDTDGFVVGWVADGALPHGLADDPFLDALAPKLFEVDGVGAALAEDQARVQWDRDRKSTWADALATLARTGRLERTMLLDGCVSRFLRGGTVRDLRWFVRLHDALEPTEDETAARVRDYVRLLPAAPSTVADLALRRLRRADELGRLDEGLFDEAVDAVLFRPEKKLVQAALIWLDRSARKRGRVDATLRAVTAVFASDSLDLRERAVKLTARHADHAGEAVQEEVRGAAAGLPPSLRETIAAAFGAVDAAAEPEAPMGPPPFVAREAPAPIGSLAELVEEFAVLLRSAEEWRAAERFVAALVEFAYRDPEATREALRKTAGDMAPWMTNTEDYSYMRAHIRRSWVQAPVLNLLRPAPPHRLLGALSSLLKGRSRTPGTEFVPQIERFLSLRREEIASAVGKVPVLLATPTEGSGHVDPGVLVARLERLEAAGVEPGRADLTQAMVRVPREIDPAAVSRARGLRSEAGRTIASWLAEGGVAGPARGDSDIARLCAFPEEHRTDSGRPDFNASPTFWVSVLPSHREVAAAHLVPYLAGTGEDDRDQGIIALDLAEADGPAGSATGTLLAYALANRHQNQRANAAEAVLALSARGGLPAAETGTALGRLTVGKHVTLTRAVKALTAAADAGAHADVWTISKAALPHALPAPGERAAAGVPDLIALATRAAEAAGAQGTMPAIEAVAGRGGSSRLVKEAARLHRALAT